MDSSELCQLCEQSLLVRSKPSLARTWSQKWKRDSWMQHLSGRILKPSLGQSFVESWTSSLEVIHASHSQQQESDSEQKTQDTCGLSSQMELLQCDQEFVSLKTSRDISRWGCPTSSKTWQDWVIEQRGGYSARLKSAHLTREKGSSSWPTATQRDYKGPSARAYKGHPENLSDITMMSWPTPTTAEAGKISCCPNYGQLGLSNHPDVHGYQVSRPKGEKSRPGQPQYAWEPPRVVGNAKEYDRGNQCERNQALRFELSSRRKAQPSLGLHSDEPSPWLDLSRLSGLGDSELAEIYHWMERTSNRTDELRLLGNGVVPIVAATAFRILSEGLM